MAKPGKDDMLVATRSGTVVLDGTTYTIRKGVTRVRGDHPLVRGREEMWEAMTPTYETETTSSSQKRGDDS